MQILMAIWRWLTETENGGGESGEIGPVIDPDG